MPGPCTRPRLTAVTLSALLVAGVLGATGQAVAAPVAADTVKRVKNVPKVLKYKELPVSSREGRAYSRVPGSGAGSSVVAAPPTGPTRSTWRPVCNGVVGFNTPGPCLQAKAAFESAISIWSQIVASPILINLNVSFAALPENVLGSAYSPYSYTNTAGTTLHVSALADALQSRDIAEEDYDAAFDPDIDAEFTTDPSISWYFGTDGATPPGQVDFKSVVLHEIGHGLGFSGTMDVDSLGGSYGSKETGSPAEPFKPIGFDKEAFNALTGGSRLTSLSAAGTTSAALATALTNGSVYWGGTQGVNAAGGSRPRLYAPSPWEAGSSFAHLDEATYPAGNVNSLMTPILVNNEAVHTPGPIAVGILADQGWTTHFTAPASAPGAPTNVTAAPANATAQVSWSAAPNNGSPITEYEVFANGAVTPVQGCDGITALSCSAQGLVNGTPYTFRVWAKNAVGTSPLSAASAQVTPSAVDTTAPTTTIGTKPADNTKLTTAEFAFSGSDPGRPTAALTFTCKLDSGTAAPCTSPTSYTGLTNGPHSFTVRATDEANNVGAEVTDTWVVDTVAPTATITSGRPADNTNVKTASFGFSVSDATPSSAVVSVTCQLDGGAASACTSPKAYSSLADGVHTFTVRATDAAGNVGTAVDTWRVDSVKPVVTVNATPVYSLASAFGVSYSATDASSGVLNYDVAYKRAAYSGAFGAWVYPANWKAITAKSVSLGASRGSTTCFVVRSRDKANNVSAWSAARCTASPLDDRHLSAATGWTRPAANAAYYASTITTAAKSGLVLTRTSAKAKQISIVATKCKGCGVIGVYLNGVLQKQISLNNAGTTVHKQVIPVITYTAVKSGTITIKTLNTGRVNIDGLGLSQV